MVRLDTNSEEKKNYREIADLIVKKAKELGLKPLVIDAKAPDGKPRPNILIRLPGKKGKRIVLITHFDVVPAGEGWSFDPFKPFVKDGKVFGRGASDNKGAIASALKAFEDLIKETKEDERNDLILAITCDEEVGGEYGVKYIAKDIEKLKPDLIWIIDAASEYISLGASGVIALKVIVKGKQCHAGYPYKGDNALHKAARLIVELEKYGKKLEKKEKSPLKAYEHYDRVPGRLNVTVIKGGVKSNVIPEKVEFILDRRVPPGKDTEKAYKELIKFIKKKEKNVEFELMAKVSSYYTDEKIPIVKRFIKVVGKKYNLRICGELGGNDGYIFANKFPVICFGNIGEDNNIHGKDEFVRISDLEKLRDAIKRVALEL